MTGDSTLADVLGLTPHDVYRLDAGARHEGMTPEEFTRRLVRLAAMHGAPGIGSLLVELDADTKARLAARSGARRPETVATELLGELLDPTRDDRTVTLAVTTADSLRGELRPGETLTAAADEASDMLARMRRGDREREAARAAAELPPEVRARETLAAHFRGVRAWRLQHANRIPGESVTDDIVARERERAETALREARRNPVPAPLPARDPHYSPLFSSGPSLPERAEDVDPGTWNLIVAEERAASWKA